MKNGYKTTAVNGHQHPTAIFFDMDDTLLDGVTAMQVSWATVCAEVAPGLGCEAEALRLAIRREAMEFWKDESLVGHWRLDLDGAREHIVRTALAAESLDASLARKISLGYKASHRENLRLFDDAIETLEAVRAAGLGIGLITNGPAPLQRDKIERFDLARHMDVIVIEGEFGAGKPERAVFEHALAAVRAEPSRAWHVGDNLYADIGGAQQVGIHAVWLHRDRLEMGEDAPAIPDRTIAHLGELRDALGA
ncbi:MAG: HAD family hydrolase [Chloroflexi bacterium]|nr:HAD family hydrolase [Chloroflexota bacterium]